jgi:hypothetical protein
LQWHRLLNLFKRRISCSQGEELLSKRSVVILIGAALLFSAPAFAIDGQILINQATVMAAGGFPYKITQPGSYKLSGNLVVAGGTDGIDVNADNVVDTNVPDAAFRWDPTGMQWIFNITTANLTAGSTYMSTITLNDGSTILFQYGLR